jgi:hypothetical protein
MIEINSKFNIGDEVYFMNNNQICKDIIKDITITYNIYSDTKVITSTSQKNVYNLKNDHKNNLGDIRYSLIFTDDNLFFTREDLITAL